MIELEKCVNTYNFHTYSTPPTIYLLFCKYCGLDGSSCLVQCGVGKEYLVDFIGKPGALGDSSSLVNGPYSLSIASPLLILEKTSLEATDNATGPTDDSVGGSNDTSSAFVLPVATSTTPKELIKRVNEDEVANDCGVSVDLNITKDPILLDFLSVNVGGEPAKLYAEDHLRKNSVNFDSQMISMKSKPTDDDHL
eukprot:Gb_39475 [translate_table: standard]